MKIGVWSARFAVALISAAFITLPVTAATIPKAKALRVHDLARSMAKVRRAFATVVPSNITVADPPVARPDTKPCTVTLFNNVAFEDFSPKPFSFTPPAACPRPWSKVVLSVNLNVTAGVQYDRTAEIGLGGSTIFFGTTAEPFSNEGPSWNVQRDLTDLTALFATAQMGEVYIANLYNSTYNGIIYGTATVSFYPVDAAYPAPRVADIVVPLADSNGNPVGLGSPTSVLAKTFTPPTNVEGAYLDVMAQSQSADEFWYTCVPNNLAAALNDCGSTAFRETDASLDGRPAGVAPVYPWIYTGGIDPFLWAPTPGVQTLNFTPYRVDLTPFAATLDDGKSHIVALTEFNADNYFAVTGNLLLFLDHGAKGPLTGGLDTDTLSATTPETITESGTFSPTGTIVTTSKRSYTIAGHVNTSQGTVRTQIATTLAFTQNQGVINSATQFEQNINQDETVNSTTTTTGAVTRSTQQTFDYPLNLLYDFVVNADNSEAQTTTIRQGYYASTFASSAGGPLTWSFISDVVAPHDTLSFDASGNFLGPSNTANSQIYESRDAGGHCYGRVVTSANLDVTANESISCGGI